MDAVKGRTKASVVKRYNYIRNLANDLSLESGTNQCLHPRSTLNGLLRLKHRHFPKRFPLSPKPFPGWTGPDNGKPASTKTASKAETAVNLYRLACWTSAAPLTAVAPGVHFVEGLIDFRLVLRLVVALLGQLLICSARVECRAGIVSRRFHKAADELLLFIIARGQLALTA